jgi:hypothetical protein
MQAELSRRAFICEEEKADGRKHMYQGSAPVNEMNQHRDGGGQSSQEEQRL